jgi:UDP-2,3-diacylglucosamine hydrolase
MSSTIIPAPETGVQLADLTFVSDLHLGPSRSALEEYFCALLARLAERAKSGREQRLYVVGDLFSFWVERPPLMRRLHARALEAMSAAVRAGCRIFVLDGNRDFGYGRAVTGLSGAEPLGESAAVELGGRTALLLHGDQLLTSDRRYQIFKRVVRSWPARTAAKWLPQALVLWCVALLERFSSREKAVKPPEAWKLDEAVAARMMQAAGADVLVCGHLHSPAERAIDVAGRPGRRRWRISGGWPGRCGPVGARPRSAGHRKAPGRSAYPARATARCSA